ALRADTPGSGQPGGPAFAPPRRAGSLVESRAAWRRRTAAAGLGGGSADQGPRCSNRADTRRPRRNIAPGARAGHAARIAAARIAAARTEAGNDRRQARA